MIDMILMIHISGRSHKIIFPLKKVSPHRWTIRPPVVFPVWLDNFHTYGLPEFRALGGEMLILFVYAQIMKNK